MTSVHYTSKSIPDHDLWPTFSVPWNDTLTGVTDMGYLLEQPAGAHGYVRIENGHLVTGNGRRWRIWGQNLTFGAALVPMHIAPIVTRRLAKFGINCIRLHHMDHRFPRGLLLRDRRRIPLAESSQIITKDHSQTTRELDPEAMARLDYFIACCKDNGIYIDLNLNVSRQFTSADGVKQAEWIGYAKSLTYFDPQIISLQKEYAQQLLNHVNTFTGNRYAEDPVIAFIELVNENSLLEAWVSGRLRGEQREPGSTWCDIPPAYAEDLTFMWNEWLTRKYRNREVLELAWDGNLSDYENPLQHSVRRLTPEEFDNASRGRFHDEVTFYGELERTFFEDMSAYLRGNLGVKQIVVGTSDHNHSIHQSLHVENNTVMGIVDGHVYWQHPRFPHSTWSTRDWTITNSPMVDTPDHAAPAQLSRSVVAGMPYIVSELNEPFPNDTAAEFIPITAAYALLQDWDGLFWFDYGGGPTAEAWQDGSIRSFFSMANDPVKMTQTAVGALTFLRGDVQAARRMVGQWLTRERIYESYRNDLPNDTYPYTIPYIPGRLALVHRTAIQEFSAPYLAPEFDDLHLPENIITSDTGELTWELTAEKGKFSIDADRVQCIVGRKGKHETSHMIVELETQFAAVQMVSLDWDFISQTRNLLLVLSARIANTGMLWTDETRCSLGDKWGSAPIHIEPVKATLYLRHFDGARSLQLQALDGRGQPLGDPQFYEYHHGQFKLVLNGIPPTLWYHLQVDR